MEMRRQGSGRQAGNTRRAGPPEAGLGLRLSGREQLTSICSMRMGSSSRRVIASGDSTVTRILSGGAEKSHQPLCGFPVSHNHMRQPKHRLWIQVNLGFGQAPASHGQSDPG